MTLKIYVSPKACTMSVRITAYELELPLEFIETTPELRKSPEYRAVHPLGKVPALVTEEGVVITELTAVLTYLAGLRETPRLIPDDPKARARCYELISLFTTEMHNVFIQAYDPERALPHAKEHKEELAAAGKARVVRLLEITDERLGEGPFAAGESFSIADAMLFVPYAWAVGLPLDMKRFPRIEAWIGRVRTRPSVIRTVVDEKLLPRA
jgi:glutathione S-transferase